MRVIITLLFTVLIGISGNALASHNRKCVFVENWLDSKANCLYMGNNGDETKSVLITPKKKISLKIAAGMLFQVVTAFDMSDYHPESITVLTDDESKGESVMVEGVDAHLPKSSTDVDPNSEAKFRRNIKVCKVVNWESKCKPLR